jgi:hypothetical protein
MRRRLLPRLLVSACLALAGAAEAGTHQGFDLETSAWTASHVVVVAKTDGVLTVVESWRGDLKPGDSLRDLASVADEGSRAFTADTRLVLFMKKKGVTEPGELPWAPAGRSALKLAAVWLDEGKAFAFVTGASGDAVFGELGAAPELRERALHVLETRAALAKALATSNAANNRLDALEPFASSDVLTARHEATLALGSCGRDALPVLRLVLTTESLVESHADALRSLVKAGGPSVGTELVKRLDEEVIFWKKTAPQLKRAWLDGVSDETLRFRFRALLENVEGLGQIAHVPGEQPIKELRALFAGESGLKDYGLLKACDEALAKLKKPSAVAPAATKKTRKP